MAKYNDIDLKKWKEYSDIYTDSLWIIGKRDKSGAHKFRYHGNFVPQIVYQLLLRYTKKGDFVLDPFMGSGTTLIEAQRLGRNSIGIELQSDIANEAKERIDKEQRTDVATLVVNENSKYCDLSAKLRKIGTDKVQFIIYHPPYWDIIKFSDNQEDLSNCPSLENFEQELCKVIDNCNTYLEDGRYCSIVIGDKYSNGQITPLGFICMNLFVERGFILKAIIVKNYGETEGKTNQQAIWRYRALSADYYVFKHEYIMVFKKSSKQKN